VAFSNNPNIPQKLADVLPAPILSRRGGHAAPRQRNAQACAASGYYRRLVAAKSKTAEKR